MAASHSLSEQLTLDMQAWQAAGLRRSLPPDEAALGVDFVSNDYLSLATHPALIAAARHALEEAGAGGRAARLLGGGSVHHARAEAAMASWLGDEAALLFPSGYQANLGAITSLVGRGDVILSDARNHASIIDGARLSRARVRVHPHLDLGTLERLLAEGQGARRRLIVTEGVFSMDGDAPDIEAMLQLAERFDAWLLVDEAHSIGILGSKGNGACRGPHPHLVRVVPCGKALGVGGAFVVGGVALHDHLLNRSRPFVFTTAPPPAVAGALEAAILQARVAEEARTHLKRLGRFLAKGLGLPAPVAAILPFRVGEPEAALQLSKQCVRAGLDVRAVRPPTVPEGEAGLRIVLHAHNTERQCERLIQVLGKQPARPTPPARAQRELLFVVGTDTDIGKTVVSALLLRGALRQGAARYWKPVQTGEDLDTLSVERMAGASDSEQPLWSLPLPASPHAAAAAAGIELDTARLDASLSALRLKDHATRLIIELAGGLLVPYRIAPRLETQADWLARAGAPLVLVARSGLGTLNHTLLTLEALRVRGLEPRALFLVGEPHRSNREALERISGIPSIFEVETLPNLDDHPSQALDAWLDAHDLSCLWNA